MAIFPKMSAMILITFQEFIETISLNKTAQAVTSEK
jgi:hypothetical protein